MMSVDQQEAINRLIIEINCLLEEADYLVKDCQKKSISHVRLAYELEKKRDLCNKKIAAIVVIKDAQSNEHLEAILKNAQEISIANLDDNINQILSMGQNSILFGIVKYLDHSEADKSFQNKFFGDPSDYGYCLGLSTLWAATASMQIEYDSKWFDDTVKLFLDITNVLNRPKEELKDICKNNFRPFVELIEFFQNACEYTPAFATDLAFKMSASLTTDTTESVLSYIETSGKINNIHDEYAIAYEFTLEQLEQLLSADLGVIKENKLVLVLANSHATALCKKGI
jgi:hypothetical protein